VNKQHQDYTIRPNTQYNREHKGLWDVVSGGSTLVTTCRSEAIAQATANLLQHDPWFLDRGQTRADRASGYAPTKFEDLT